MPLQAQPRKMWFAERSRFICDLSPKLTQGRIKDRLGKLCFRNAFDAQVLNTDTVVVPDQFCGQFVNEILSLIGNSPMQRRSCVLSVVSPCFASVAEPFVFAVAASYGLVSWRSSEPEVRADHRRRRQNLSVRSLRLRHALDQPEAKQHREFETRRSERQTNHRRHFARNERLWVCLQDHAIEQYAPCQASEWKQIRPQPQPVAGC